jgi:hypothetical protein
MRERTKQNSSSIQHQYVYKLYTTYFLSYVQIALKSLLKFTIHKFTLSPSRNTYDGTRYLVPVLVLEVLEVGHESSRVSPILYCFYSVHISTCHSVPQYYKLIVLDFTKLF